MVDGNKLGDVGFKYIGIPYSTMDCQAFWEKCLSDCGFYKNLAGSNAWYREIMNNGVILTPEECVKQLGRVPPGAALFILKQDGKEPDKYRKDGIGNASHIGICTGSRGKGAIASSASRGCVAESEFHGKSINGGWNRVGLYDKVAYDYGNGSGEPVPVWRTTLRRGSKGEDVKYCQQLLMEHGYDLSPYYDDGDFGRKTEAAVIELQKAYGLNPDGVVGPLTWDALMDTPLVKMTYTVTISGLSKEEADSFKQVYPDAIIKEE